MHSSALLTSALAVGALALPQGQIEKRQQGTVTVTVTVTVPVSVFANPYATPAWTAPQFSQTPNTRRPANAPPLWTPPQIGNPTPRPPRSSTRTSSAASGPATSVASSSSSSSSVVVGPSSSTAATAGPTSNGLTSSSVAPSGSVGVPTGVSSSVVASGVSSSAVTTPAPSNAPLDPGHTPGEGQATLSAGLEYQNAILYHHNAARANHNADPLVWDDAVAQTAAECANTCVFEHYVPEGAGQGQNLFTVSGDDFNVTAGITESWYKDEFQAMLPYFGAANIPDDVFSEVGHLTQLLWKGTTRVGCVSIDCGDRMIVGGQSSTLNKYTVCNYAPAGNVYGQYDVNIGNPISTTDLGSWSD